jgi:hypothetical protein
LNPAIVAAGGTIRLVEDALGRGSALSAVAEVSR